MRLGLPRWGFSILATLLVLTLPACDREFQLIEIEGSTMGTVYSVRLNAAGFGGKKAMLKSGIEDILQEINRQMSTWDPNSVLSDINRHAGTDWIDIPEDLYEVLKASLEIARQTDGALDISIGPLVNLWGFGPEENAPAIPNEHEIQALLERTGYRLLELDPESARLRKKRSEVYIDLSAIAKGFAVDEIAHYLDSRGIRDYLVEVGGEIQAHGINPDGKPWQIGIEKPVSNEFSIQRIVPLSNQGMATSGDYRNYRMIEGIRYSHTIDPRTGKPVSHDLAAVTVIHPSTMMADGFATALLVLGPETGLEFAEKMNLSVLFVIRQEDGFFEKMTPSFRQLISAGYP